MHPRYRVIFQKTVGCQLDFLWRPENECFLRSSNSVPSFGTLPDFGCISTNRIWWEKRSRKNRTVCFPGSVSPYLMQFRSQPKSATLRHEFWQNTGCLTFCSRKNSGTRRSKATSPENRDRQKLVIYANVPRAVTTYNFVLVMLLFIRLLTLYREKMQKNWRKYPRHLL